MVNSLIKCTWLLLFGAGLSAVSCDQPRLKCQSQRGGYAAQYRLKSGDPNSICGKLVGGVLGVNTYNPERPDGLWDSDKPAIAIQATTMTALVARAQQGLPNPKNNPDPEPSHKLYAFGAFTGAEAGPDEFCTASKLEDAYQALPEAPPIPDDPTTPEVDESEPGQPATKLRYRWTNLKLYNTAAIPGSVFSAELEVTQNDCAATYSVWALYPVTACAKLEKNLKGDWVETEEPDQNRCVAIARPELGIITAPAVNPLLALSCDKNLLECVPEKDPPSLQ